MIWHNVGYYNNHTDKTNTFQLLLVNRDDVSRGDFDIVFNYDQIQWDTGDTTGNSADPGGVAAHVGYHSLNQCFNYGCGINSAFLALARTRAHSTASIRPAAATGGGGGRSVDYPGSGTSGAFLDSNMSTGLIHNSYNSLQQGRYIFRVRNTSRQGSGSISGAVYQGSASTGNAVAGANVQACPSDNFAPCQSTTSHGDGTYEVDGLAGFTQYRVTAFPPSSSSGYFSQSIDVYLSSESSPSTGNTIVLQQLVTPESTGSSVTQNPPRSSNGVPLIYWGQPFTLQTTGKCANGTATYNIAPETGPSRSGTLDESPAGSGAYVATVPAVQPTHGHTRITITINNCLDGSTQTAGPFDIFIDPSGAVIDDTDGTTPINGATVTLLRSDTGVAGTFTPAPATAIELPLAHPNPETSGASDGLYGWNVLTGYYIVQVSKPGYMCPATHTTTTAMLDNGTTQTVNLTCVPGTGGAPDSVQTDALPIPPAAAGLTIYLKRIITNSCPPNCGGGTSTPELGSGELLATGLAPITIALLYRRRRMRRAEREKGTAA